MLTLSLAHWIFNQHRCSYFESIATALRDRLPTTVVFSLSLPTDVEWEREFICSDRGYAYNQTVVKGPSKSAPVLKRQIMNFIFSNHIKKGHKYVQFAFPFQIWKMMSGIWPPLQRWHARSLSVKFAKTAWQLVEFPPLSRGSFWVYSHVPLIRDPQIYWVGCS